MGQAGFFWGSGLQLSPFKSERRARHWRRDSEGRKRRDERRSAAVRSLDMLHQPLTAFVGLNFFLCYICRLRFRQTSGGTKARRYYSEKRGKSDWKDAMRPC